MKKPVNFGKIYGLVFEVYDFSNNGLECTIQHRTGSRPEVDELVINTLNKYTVERNGESIKSIVFEFDWDNDTFSIVRNIEKKGKKQIISSSSNLTISTAILKTKDSFVDAIAGFVEVEFYGWMSNKRLNQF